MKQRDTNLLSHEGGYDKRDTYLRVVIIVILSALSVLHEAIHVILETGRDVARLQECSISIDVVVVPREEVIHLAETLVLHQ